MLTTSLQLVVAAYPLTLTKDTLMSNQTNEVIFERIYDEVLAMDIESMKQELRASANPLYYSLLRWNTIEQIQEMVIEWRLTNLSDCPY